MCDTCEYKNTIDEIEEMLDDEDYEYAKDTLEGILEWVEEHEHVTEAQTRAVANIKRGAEIRR